MWIDRPGWLIHRGTLGYRRHTPTQKYELSSEDSTYAGKSKTTGGVTAAPFGGLSFRYSTLTGPIPDLSRPQPISARQRRLNSPGSFLSK